MQPPRSSEPDPPSISDLFPAARRQWLAVDGFVTDRFLVNYRAPASRLAALVPAPFTLDSYDGYGFLSAGVVAVRDMGIASLPRAFRFHNLQVLYRLGVRFRGEPSFVTLRSDTSSRALACLGGWFSHYRLRAARIELSRAGGRFALEAHTSDASGDAHFDVVPARATSETSTSVFRSSEAADRQLLGMSFTVDPGRRGRVLVQPVEHTPWRARFVEPREKHFGFLERLSQRYSVPLEYDSTLALHDIQQTWHAALWVRSLNAAPAAWSPSERANGDALRLAA